MIYNAVLASAIQQSESVIHISLELCSILYNDLYGERKKFNYHWNRGLLDHCHVLRNPVEGASDVVAVTMKSKDCD